MGVLVGGVIGGAKVKMASRELKEIDDSYCITLDQLPYLCLVNICDFLAPEDVAKFGSVCKVSNFVLAWIIMFFTRHLEMLLDLKVYGGRELLLLSLIKYFEGDMH